MTRTASETFRIAPRSSLPQDEEEDVGPSPNLHVYHGGHGTFEKNQSELERATEIIGVECDALDGFQSDFYVPSESLPSLVAKLNDSGLVANAIFEGKSIGSVREAPKAMRTYPSST